MRDAGDPIMDSGPTTPASKGTQPLTKEDRAICVAFARRVEPSDSVTSRLHAAEVLRYEATVAELEARCAALEADREALIDGSVRAIYDDDWRVMNTETGLAADPRSFATADEALQAYHASRSRTPTTSTTIWRRAMSDPQPQRPVSEAPTPQQDDGRCDRCEQPEASHRGLERFCPFYSTYRAERVRTAPPQEEATTVKCSHCSGGFQCWSDANATNVSICSVCFGLGWVRRPSAPSSAPPQEDVAKARRWVNEAGIAVDVMPPLPHGAKALTLIMLDTETPTQADAAIDAIRETSTQVVVSRDELWLHQIRLRVAQNPTLTDKISVYLLRGGKYHTIGLGESDVFRWPQGFCNAAWEIEMAMVKARAPSSAPTTEEKS